MKKTSIFHKYKENETCYEKWDNQRVKSSADFFVT